MLQLSICHWIKVASMRTRSTKSQTAAASALSKDSFLTSNESEEPTLEDIEVANLSKLSGRKQGVNNILKSCALIHQQNGGGVVSECKNQPGNQDHQVGLPDQNLFVTPPLTNLNSSSGSQSQFSSSLLLSENQKCQPPISFNNRPYNLFSNFSENSRGSGFSEPTDPMCTASAPLDISFSSADGAFPIFDENSRQSTLSSDGLFQMPREMAAGPRCHASSSQIQGSSSINHGSMQCSSSSQKCSKSFRKRSSPSSDTSFSLKLADSSARRSLFPTPGYSSERASQDFQSKAKSQLDEVRDRKAQLWRYNFKDDQPFNSKSTPKARSPNTIMLPLTGGSTPSSSRGGSSLGDSIRSSPLTNSESDAAKIINWKLENNAPNFYKRTTRSQVRKNHKSIDSHRLSAHAHELLKPKPQQYLKLPKKFQESLQTNLGQMGNLASLTSLTASVASESLHSPLTTLEQPKIKKQKIDKEDGSLETEIRLQSPEKPATKTRFVRINNRTSNANPNKRKKASPVKECKTPKRQHKITDFISPRKNSQKSSKSTSPKSGRKSAQAEARQINKVKKKIVL